MTRSEIVWYRIDIAEQDLSPETEQKLISSLPMYVEQLRIGYRSGCVRQSLKLPDVFLELRKHCPHLNALIIENALLAKSAYPHRMMGGYVLNCKVPEKEQVLRYYGELICDGNEADTDFRALHYLLRNVSELSLRKSVFAIEDIFPSQDFQVPSSKIKVLDMTESLSATDRAVVSFCRLPCLEELYLSGTAVTINGVLTILKALPRLKVLDLDSTVVGGETFTVLKKHGKFLKQIYIGETAIKDSDLIDLDEDTFPDLQELCLARTRVTETGVENLLDALPSLKTVTVTQSCVLPGWILELHPAARAKVECRDHENDEHCNHFLKNKYKGVFRNHHYVNSYK